MAITQSATMFHAIRTTYALDAAEPLYKRAPRQDEQGRPLSDFMMIIPQLRLRPQQLIQSKAEKIRLVLEQFGDIVVFADLNLKINVLWVIVRQNPRACLDIPLAIIDVVPEALLVSHPRFF